MSEMNPSSETENALLRGGPPTLPQVFRIADALIADKGRLIISHCGRNEHFTFTGKLCDVEGMKVSVAEWAYSTSIAE